MKSTNVRAGLRAQECNSVPMTKVFVRREAVLGSGLMRGSPGLSVLPEKSVLELE